MQVAYIPESTLGPCYALWFAKSPSFRTTIAGRKVELSGKIHINTPLSPDPVRKCKHNLQHLAKSMITCCPNKTYFEPIWRQLRHSRVTGLRPIKRFSGSQLSTHTLETWDWPWSAEAVSSYLTVRRGWLWSTIKVPNWEADAVTRAVTTLRNAKTEQSFSASLCSKLMAHGRLFEHCIGVGCNLVQNSIKNIAFIPSFFYGIGERREGRSVFYTNN